MAQSDPSYFDAAREYQEDVQSRVLAQHGKSRELAAALARETHALAAEFLEEVGSAFETDCKQGCAHCCHQPATVFPFEAIQIAQRLRSSRTPEELNALKRAMESRVRGLGVRSVKANINNKTACPLLEQGSCSVYTDRPLTCRMAHSFSVQNCRASFEGDRFAAQIPISLEIQTGMSGILEAAFEGLPRAGLDGQLYELCSAVLAALADPDADLKWAQADASVFAGCVRDDT